MFSILLKKKLEIEAKVSYNQKKYLELLRLQNIDPEENPPANEQELKKILQQKNDSLVKISQEYNSIFDVYKELKDTIEEQKIITSDIDDCLNKLAENLNIQFPEEFLRKEKQPAFKIVQVPTIVTNQFSDNPVEENKEEEENSDESDKENSFYCEKGDCEEYFSPIINIRKSLHTDDKSSYTPAIKSHSKNPQFK